LLLEGRDHSTRNSPIKKNKFTPKQPRRYTKRKYIHSLTFPLISSANARPASVAVVLAPNPAWLTLDFILVLLSRSGKKAAVSVFAGS
jgi:hypothetical protein